MFWFDYLAAFGSAFLAATILPIYSEVVVVALMRDPAINLWALWLAASAGNTLGAVLNWCLGRFLMRWRDSRWFPVTPRALDTAQRWFSRYGVWSLLLAWTPILGDPLTFVAGILRVRLGVFVVLVGLGKAARYAVVIGLADVWI